MGITRKRTYRKHNHAGTLTTVKAWIQERCIICGRFLTKRQMKYCSECSKDKNRYIREREYRKQKAKGYYYNHEEEINYKRWLNHETHRIIL